jgi:hypothetical protein
VIRDDRQRRSSAHGVEGKHAADCELLVTQNAGMSAKICGAEVTGFVNFRRCVASGL